MNKLDAIAISKQIRKDADELLQRMKAHRKVLVSKPMPDGLSAEHTLGELEAGKHIANDLGEAIAQHTISIRDLESAIMRQGLSLKAIGAPDPYPASKDPSSPVVEPTADGLTL